MYEKEIKKNIEQKIVDLLDYIKSGKEKNVNEFIGKFKLEFKGEYLVYEKKINQAYFESKVESFYLSNGIVLEASSGDWDRMGNTVSHQGTDVIIYSKLSKNQKLRNGIVIFNESDYCENELLENISDLFNIDLTEESLKRNQDNYVYNTLQLNELNQSKELLDLRYNQLKKEAIEQHIDEVDYEMISPWGGVDVVVHSIEELLYGYLIEFKNDKQFIKNAMVNFYNEFGENYIDEEIKKCKKILYFIDNKYKYFKLFELEKAKQLSDTMKQGYAYSDIKEELESKKTELHKYITEANNLKNHKYNWKEILSGKKVKNMGKLVELQGDKIKKGKILILKEIINELEERAEEERIIVEEYTNKFNEDSLKLELEKEKLNLLYEFENFTIDDKYLSYDPYYYEDGSFGPQGALERMIENRDNTKSRLTELIDMKNIAINNSKNQIKKLVLQEEKEYN